MSRVVHMGVKYDPLTELDIDELVDRLTPGEIQKLLDECDPDDPEFDPTVEPPVERRGGRRVKGTRSNDV